MKLTGIIETIFEGRYVFRGFATLEELALYSKPNYNYQRVPDEKRISNLSKFIIGNNPYKFFTELLFGYSFSDPIEKNLIAILKKHYSIVIDQI